MFPIHASEQKWVLSPDEWSHSRDGQSLASMSALKQGITAWGEQSNSKLVIYPPGG